LKLIDIITLKHPGIQRISVWDTQYDGTPWAHPYDGLIWENIDIPKPSKEELAQWEIDVAPQHQFNLNKIANQPIYDQLDALDIKCIRPIRENDNVRLNELNAQAASLRSQLLPVK
jgi:hypothetical protein